MASTELQQDLQDAKTAQEAAPTASHPSKVIVGIPCYNEEVAIGSLVLRASQYADAVVVIDDGSTDKTREVARLAGAYVIVQEANMGKGAALREFFKYASQQRADIIVVLDGDGQHDPDDIPKLLAPLLSDEADVVNGSRYLDGDGSDTPRYRRFGQRVLDRFTRLALNKDLPITDTQSGFRAFSIKSVPYFGFDSDRLAIDSEMLMDAAKARLRIAEVGVTVRYDVGRSSVHPVRHGAQVLTGVVRNVEFRNPLLAFTVPGACLIAAGLAVGFYVIDYFLRFGKVVYGPTMLTILLTVVGVLMAVTGILLHSVSSLTSSPEKNR
jgi:glycosyltransferase involved in cell wall biosynthesis